MSTEILYEIRLRKNANEYLNQGRPYLNDIDGLSELSFEMERNPEYVGLFKKVIAPLKFVGKAGEEIEAIYNADFIHAILEVDIRMKNPTTQNYELVGVFQPDWSTYRKMYDGIQVELKEGGLSEYLETNADKSYQINYQQDGGSLPVNITGMWLFGYQDWIIANYVDNEETDAYWAKKYFPLGIYDRNTEYSEISAYTTMGKVITYASVAEKNQLLIVVNISGEFLFSATFAAYYKNSSASADPVRMQLYAVVKESIDSNVTVSATLLWQDSSTLNPGNDRNVLVAYQNISVYAEEGQAIELYFADKVTSPTIGRNGFSYAIGDGDYFRVDTRFKLPQTQTQSKRYFSVLNRVIQEMTEFKYGLQSPYLTNPNLRVTDMTPYNVVITSENAIKNAPTQYIKASLTDLWTDLRSRDAIGLGLEGDFVVIKPLTDFYQKDFLIADLGEVADMQISTASDLIPNKIMIGYETQDTDDKNAESAFNNTQEWGTNVKGRYEDWELVSPVIADPYAIEKLRSQQFQKDTNKGSSLSDGLILLCIAQNLTAGEGFVLQTPAYSGFPFLVRPYNFPISPKRSLIRKSPEIASRLYKSNGQLTFQNQPTFYYTGSNLYGGWVYEKESPFVFSAAPLLFKPIYFEFECKKLPKNFLSLIAANRYGVLRFRFNGVTYDGFIQELTVKGKDGGKFRLLSSPNNNF